MKRGQDQLWDRAHEEEHWVIRVGSGCGELDSIIGRRGTMVDGYLIGWDGIGLDGLIRHSTVQ